MKTRYDVSPPSFCKNIRFPAPDSFFSSNYRVIPIIVGRFPADSPEDVAVQTAKAIAYENNPDMAGGWYRRGLGIGSGEGAGSGDDGEADFKHIDIIKENKLLPLVMPKYG